MVVGKSICYKGVGIFPGIAIGKSHLIRREPQVVDRHFITMPDREIERVKIAFERAITQLQSVRDKVVGTELSDHASIIDAHLMMLKDPNLKRDVFDFIRERMINAEWAVDLVIDEYKKMFDRSGDSYISERSRDLEHVKQEILKALMDEGEERDLESLDEGVIVVAYDLTPADTLRLNFRRLKGFVTEGGGRTSHTAILARSLEIPAVIQVQGITDSVEGGKIVVVDGIRGIVILDPEDKMLSSYREEKKKLTIIERKLLSNVDEPAVTKDGFRVRLYANLELLEEIPSAVRHGSEGVGLFRTEYLYLRSRELPSVEQQFRVYKHLAEEFGERPVIIRTLDLGGEKYIPSLRLRREMNPALGLRAVRLCLEMKRIFSDQIESILMASSFGNLKILIPLVTRYEDMEESVEFIERIKNKLRGMGKKFNENIEVGAMLEVPSSIYIIDKLSELVDFFSVGTNDLVQYTLAVDRGNDAVSHYFDPIHPSVLKLLKDASTMCRELGKPISICGEIGGNPLIVPLLIALGYSELSMNPLYIPVIKEVIKRQDSGDTKALLEDIMASKRSSDAWRRLSSYFIETTRDISDLIEPFIPYIPYIN